MDVITALPSLGALALFLLFALLGPRVGVDGRGLTDRAHRWSPDAVHWDDGAWLGCGPAAPGLAPPTAGAGVAGRWRGRRLPRRLGQLYAGLVLYGVSMAFLVQAQLGVMPWDVLHQGLARWLHQSLGTMAIAVGALVLLGWVPLRQVPGVGTVSNVFAIGLALDAALRVLPAPQATVWRVLFVVLGLVLNAVATAAYIGAGLGPGPRDGLMTGLVRRSGRPVWWVRTGIEVSVVAVGWLLGGNLGPGTVLYAVAIGPLVHPLLPRLAVAVDRRDEPGAPSAGAGRDGGDTRGDTCAGNRAAQAQAVSTGGDPRVAVEVAGVA